MRYSPDPIAAIATANGYAGIGVVRISGANLQPIIQGLIGKDSLKPRFAHYSDFYAADGSVVDAGLILYFPGPRSFTGEDVIELQGHGSPMALKLILQRCLELGCRLAEAGEFSQRAYLNGKLDLVQAESIVDLIHAESEASAKGALKSLKGEFSAHIEQINQRLINLRMFVEATLDFPEEDIEFIAAAKIKHKLEELQQAIHQLLSSTKQGVLLNHGANIVIVGRPNVGKSSLLNALAQEDVAIVTDVAGTTRDIVRQKIIIDGIPFNIIDTAGIRATDDIVEKIGIQRTLAAISSADLCLIMLDADHQLQQAEQQILEHIPATLPRVYVHNKIDLNQIQPQINLEAGIAHVYLSAKHNLGLDLLRQQLLALIGWQNTAGDTFIARTRHLDAMRQTVTHIERAFANWEHLEILAEELRYAHHALGSIVGNFSADELLGEIFSKFCIGK